MLTTSTPAARSASKDVAGERKWYFFPSTGSPRSVIAVSRFTTVTSAPDSTGATGASTPSGSASSCSLSGGPVDTAPGSVSPTSGKWMSPANANVTGWPFPRGPRGPAVAVVSVGATEVEPDIDGVAVVGATTAVCDALSGAAP